MTDVELYQHICKYVYEVHKDGYCFVHCHDYNEFAKRLPIDYPNKVVNAYITHNGDLVFNIKDVSHFFDDFKSFKKNFIKERGV